MQTKDFDFELPPELIAQEPLVNRDQSRLMVVDRSTGGITHGTFCDVISYLNPGDCLVINNTRVMPARIYGVKDSGAKVEFLLLKNLGNDDWETLVKPGKKAQVGAAFVFGQGLTGKIIGHGEEGTRIIHFDYSGVFLEVLAEIGTMPLPPYIVATLEDQERYQTIYSKHMGSSAAPTAGLHFTQSLLDALGQNGVDIVPVMLHVGLGTFRPVKVECVETHVMHEEYYELSEASAERINAAKARGNKIVAVGTTSVRTLETCTTDEGIVVSGSGMTSIFIYPGYTFKCVDQLITNFHLPESTLLMLISAFANKPLIMEAYSKAIAERYRFFSFGDAMMIV
jgi:S-adenosylmethionine:tRNA ribosyltransferase-isomerase